MAHTHTHTHIHQVDQTTSATKDSDFWTASFREAIAGIGKTICLLSPWHYPVPISRAWCLFEIATTVTTGAELQFLLLDHERQRLEETVLAKASNPYLFENTFAKVSQLLVLLTFYNLDPVFTRTQNTVTTATTTCHHRHRRTPPSSPPSPRQFQCYCRLAGEYLIPFGQANVASPHAAARTHRLFHRLTECDTTSHRPPVRMCIGRWMQRKRSARSTATASASSQ
jgi:hypothetical protein